MRTFECPKCSSRMDEGFLLDRASEGNGQATWVEGGVQKSFWLGIVLKGRTQIPVRTFRCRTCGFLESYAKPY